MTTQSILVRSREEIDTSTFTTQASRINGNGDYSLQSVGLCLTTLCEFLLGAIFPSLLQRVVRTALPRW